MKKQTASELMEMANKLQEQAAAREREYSVAVMEGTAGDALLQEVVKLRVEADATRRAAEEAKRIEADQAEKRLIEELQRGMKLFEGYKAKALQEKEAGIALIAEGIERLTTAKANATAADGVKSSHNLPVPSVIKIALVYQAELLRLYTVLKRTKGTLTAAELELLAALEKFK